MRIALSAIKPASSVGTGRTRFAGIEVDPVRLSRVENLRNLLLQGNLPLFNRQTGTQVDFNSLSAGEQYIAAIKLVTTIKPEGGRSLMALDHPLMPTAFNRELEVEYLTPEERTDQLFAHFVNQLRQIRMDKPSEPFPGFKPKVTKVDMYEEFDMAREIGAEATQEIYQRLAQFNDKYEFRLPPFTL